MSLLLSALSAISTNVHIEQDCQDLPVGDLYQDEISKDMLCLKMGPKYNTAFTDGKKNSA